jgi:hypothetical protein
MDRCPDESSMGLQQPRADAVTSRYEPLKILRKSNDRDQAKDTKISGFC